MLSATWRGMAEILSPGVEGAGETGYWWLNITGFGLFRRPWWVELGCAEVDWSVLPAFVDWIVVRVVDRECWLWFGEEKVLPAPAPSILLKAPPCVVVVAALLWPASLWTVSALVASVGAPLL